jgi:hypothetical protein
MKKKVKSKSAGGILDRVVPVSKLAPIITALLYGRGGTGKTTIAGTFPKPLLLLDISEKGTDSISDQEGIDVLRVQNWDDIEQIYWELDSKGNKYKTVAIDAVHAMQAMAISYAKFERTKKPEMESGQTTKHDFMRASGMMQTWLTSFRDLEDKGIHVVFIAHDRLTAGEESDDDEGMLAPEVGPRLMPSVASLLVGAVKVVGHTFIRETITKSKQLGKKPKRETEYCLRIGPHSYYTTKVRSPKSSEVPDYLVDPTFEDILEVVRSTTSVKTNSSTKKKLKK